MPVFFGDPYEDPLNTGLSKAKDQLEALAQKGVLGSDLYPEDIRKIREDLSMHERIIRGENPLEAAAGIAGTLVGGLKQVPTVISKDIFGGIGKIMEDPAIAGAMKKFSEASGNAPAGPITVPKSKGTPPSKTVTSPTEAPPSPKRTGLYDDSELAALTTAAEEKENQKAKSFNRNGKLRAFNIGGKVVFSNYDLPTDSSTGAKPEEIDYRNATGDMRRLVRKDLGLPIASDPGSVSVIQGTDEMIRDRATRDAMMKNAAAEAVMTTDDKFKRQLEQSKQLAQAQSEVKTQGTIDQYRKLAELMSGAKVEPDTPVFNDTKIESFKKLQMLRDKGAEETKRPDGTPKTDEELWKEAWVAAKQKHDKEFADQVWRVFLTEKRADPALMYNMSGTDSTSGG